MKLQGQIVLKDLDVVKEAGAPLTALVKEIKGVKAGESLVVEFATAGKEPAVANAPILCALEVRDETFTPPVVVSLKDAKAANEEDHPPAATEPDDMSVDDAARVD